MYLSIYIENFDSYIYIYTYESKFPKAVSTYLSNAGLNLLAAEVFCVSVCGFYVP